MGAGMSSVGSEIYEWASRGACTTGDPDALFVQGAAQHRAKIVCSGCEVRTECLAEALDSQVEFGVWGGMTERERRAILRRRPDVKSWRELLLTARDNHATDVIDLRTPRVEPRAVLDGTAQPGTAPQ
ncbi:MAG: WhiB family transcriptional regulator [Actinobacteria bacterium]|nr:WhiB family transcriptional regulator [Actinomycetota bacterium]